MDKGKYKTTAYSIATETYRRIERFLMNDCQKKIKPIGHEELRSIFSIILNFRRYLPQKDGEVMTNFIKMNYGMEPVTISMEGALSLYKELVDILKQKLTEKFVSPVFNDKREKLRPHIFKTT